MYQERKNISESSVKICPNHIVLVIFFVWLLVGLNQNPNNLNGNDIEVY